MSNDETGQFSMLMESTGTWYMRIPTNIYMTCILRLVLGGGVMEVGPCIRGECTAMPVLGVTIKSGLPVFEALHVWVKLP